MAAFAIPTPTVTTTTTTTGASLSFSNVWLHVRQRGDSHHQEERGFPEPLLSSCRPPSTTDPQAALSGTGPYAAACRTRAILQGISASAMPGEMMAIIGPSGCGKSSLLDVLAGRTPLRDPVVLPSSSAAAAGAAVAVEVGAVAAMEIDVDQTLADPAGAIASAQRATTSALQTCAPHATSSHHTTTSTTFTTSTSTTPSPLRAAPPPAGVASGWVLYGQRRIQEVPAYARHMVYVPQDDVFVPVLTVRETLAFHARLHGLDSLSHVSEMLRAVRLDHVAETMVGGLLPGGFSVRGISGGERRRLTIACAMIADPEVVLLDEPTSGLDAESAQSIIRLLHEFARHHSPPRIVICAIHQPRSSVFHLFASVLVMSRGRQLFFGRPEHVVPHFRALSALPVDVFTSAPDYALDAVAVLERGGHMRNCEDGVFAESRLDLAAPLGTQPPLAGDTIPITLSPRGHALADAAASDAVAPGGTTTSTLTLPPAAAAAPFAVVLAPSRPQSAECPDLHKLPLIPTAKQEAVSRRRRLRVLLGRAWKYFARNPGNYCSRLLVCLFLGVLVGLIFRATPRGPDGVAARLGVLFFLALMIILLPFQTITLFQDMRQYYLREHAARLYGSAEFYVAHLALESGMVLLCTLLLVVPVYWLVGLQAGAGAFGFAVAQYLVMYLCSSSLMSAVSILAPNLDLAFLLGAFFMTVFMLFAGFFVLLADVPAWLRWVAYLNYIKYGFQGIVINEFSDQTELGVVSQLGFDVEPGSRAGCFAVTLAWLAAFALQAATALRFLPTLCRRGV